MKNWAGNQAYHARRIHSPRSLEALQGLVRTSARIRAVGSRHSFNDVADTTGDLISLADLPRTVEIDAAAGRVTVGGGLRYGDVAGTLDRHGVALANLASLPHISIAGACATGTHGSGIDVGSLATAVSGLEFVGADGERRTVERRSGDGALAASVVSLGALGIVTRLTLDVEPTFWVRQQVFDDVPFDAVLGGSGARRRGRLQREPVHRLARPDVPGRGSSIGFARMVRRCRDRCSGRGRPASTATRSPASTRAPARSSAASPVRGISGSPTSGWGSRRAPATSSRASISSTGGTHPRRSTPWRGSRPADRAPPPGQRDPVRRGRRPVAEPRLPPRVGDDPLHVESGLARRAEPPPRHRGRPRRRSSRGRTGASCSRWTPSSSAPATSASAPSPTWPTGSTRTAGSRTRSSGGTSWEIPDRRSRGVVGDTRFEPVTSRM